MAADIDKYNEAIKAGYSDAEIAQHLAGPKYMDALQSGYSNQDIIQHLTGKTIAPQPVDDGMLASVKRGIAIAKAMPTLSKPGIGGGLLNASTKLIPQAILNHPETAAMIGAGLAVGEIPTAAGVVGGLARAGLQGASAGGVAFAANKLRGQSTPQAAKSAILPAATATVGTGAIEGAFGAGSALLRNPKLIALQTGVTPRAAEMASKNPEALLKPGMGSEETVNSLVGEVQGLFKRAKSSAGEAVSKVKEAIGIPQGDFIDVLKQMAKGRRSTVNPNVAAAEFGRLDKAVQNDSIASTYGGYKQFLRKADDLRRRIGNTVFSRSNPLSNEEEGALKAAYSTLKDHISQVAKLIPGGEDYAKATLRYHDVMDALHDLKNGLTQDPDTAKAFLMRLFRSNEELPSGIAKGKYFKALELLGDETGKTDLLPSLFNHFGAQEFQEPLAGAVRASPKGTIMSLAGSPAARVRAIKLANQAKGILPSSKVVRPVLGQTAASELDQ